MGTVRRRDAQVAGRYVSDTDSRRRGLYDDFRGYRVPAEVELTRALRTATVMVDANVLLNRWRSCATCSSLRDRLRPR